jgi:histidinol-phosphate aminotransferase
MIAPSAYIDDLVRPGIRELVPYRCARDAAAGGVLLDANESPYPAPAGPDDIPLNRYPDPRQSRLRARIAELNGVSPATVFAGSGSDEIIDLLIRIFCEPGRDAVIVAEPTYGIYRVAAAINGVEVVAVPLTAGFGLDPEAMLDRLSPRTKLIFCCSPNNPTGNLLREEDIAALCEGQYAIVVVDEAYIDFAPGRSVARLLSSTPNLVVLRTLSKAWGMAGIRLGYALAGEPIVGYLDRVKHPYNIGTPAAAWALAALDREDLVRRRVEVIVAEREMLRSRLREMPCVERVYPSDANFILVRCHDAALVHSSLARGGIAVRDRSGDPGLENCLRITVGTPEQNALLLARMEELP